jgi:hypothetical protein
MEHAALCPHRNQTIVGFGLLPAELAAWWIFWKWKWASFRPSDVAGGVDQSDPPGDLLTGNAVGGFILFRPGTLSPTSQRPLARSGRKLSGSWYNNQVAYDHQRMGCFSLPPPQEARPLPRSLTLERHRELAGAKSAIRGLKIETCKRTPKQPSLRAIHSTLQACFVCRELSKYVKI